MRGSRMQLVGIALAASLIGSNIGVATAAELPSTGPEFDDYQPVPLLGDAPAYAGPPTVTSLADVRLAQEVDAALTPQAREKLLGQGFVIVPSQIRLFHEAYDGLLSKRIPAFVTTDIAYHDWHLVFDKILRDLEQQQLLPALEKLVKGMRKNAATQAEELTGTALEDDATRIHELLSVTAAVLGLEGVKLSKRAKAEKALIDEHSQAVKSPILDTITDYSVFAPRGHYTRNEDLKRYFVAMSVLGQHAFTLPDARDPGSAATSGPEGLRRAVLASRTLVGRPKLEALWRQIFEPTAFLVGVSDDYTPFELAAAVEATVPGGTDGTLAATDDASLFAIADALAAARPVLIDPERPSVRVMGTRFVIDSWIFDQLISPNVGTEEEPRPLGSPLDLAAAFGSDYALAIQDEAGETEKLHYPEQMAAMQGAVAARPEEAWGNTVYDAWLKAVEPMWLPHGEAFPDFMQGDAWKAKAQQTGFGSYAELKHDTILYTKQPTGETGGGPPEPPPITNWVEPDPVPFGRLSALATLTRDGLLSRELLPKDQKRLLDDYIELVDRLERIATEELAGEPISERDNEWLSFIDSTFWHIWSRTGDEPQPWERSLDEDAAIIADIMRGLGGVDQVLEIGTGYVDRIYVLVPGEKGRFQVAVGGVYSYYEFPWPTSDRLTDERWREMLRDGEAPDRPAWQAPLLAVPAPVAEQEDPPGRKQLEQQLGATIGGATWEPYRKSPRGADFDPFKAGAWTGVIFDGLEKELHRSVDYVVLFSFFDTGDMIRYWQGRAEAAAAEAPERDGACADGQPGRGLWAHGEYLCYVSDSGRAQLRWTDEWTDTYGVLNAVVGNKNLKSLYRHWESSIADAE